MAGEAWINWLRQALANATTQEEMDAVAKRLVLAYGREGEGEN